jgi:AraC-like DNA-binding protein
VHMNRYHFVQLFEQSTGVPPHRFVLQERLETARALLAAATLPIAAVARPVGFRTPSHFSGISAHDGLVVHFQACCAFDMDWPYRSFDHLMVNSKIGDEATVQTILDGVQAIEKR